MSGNGSHIVDACWEATLTMNLNRKAIAEELVAKEAEIRPSFFGSRVWRNWKMDKFKTRRGEWMGMGKAAVVAKAESNGVEVKKTPIQVWNSLVEISRQPPNPPIL